METLSSRVSTAVIGFLVVSAIVYLGWWAMLPALLLVSVMGLFEYVRMLDYNDIDVRRGTLAVFGSAILIASLPMLPDTPWPGGSWREAVLTVAVGYLLVIEVIRPG